MKRKKNSPPTDETVQLQSFDSDAEQVPSDVSNDSTFSTKGKHSMSTNFDFASLQTAETEQAAADFSEYNKMLREISSGKCKRSKTEILTVLKDVDRDSAMLQADVEKRAKRDAMIAEYDKEKEYETERNSLDSQLSELWAEFEKVKEQYNKKDWPIRCKRDELNRKLREISGYRSELLESCDDMALILEREEAQSRLHNPAERLLYENQRRIADEIATMERTLHNLPITIDRGDRKRELKAEIMKSRARYEEGENKKLEFSKQEEKQKAVIREIEGRMIHS